MHVFVVGKTGPDSGAFYFFFMKMSVSVINDRWKNLFTRLEEKVLKASKLFERMYELFNRLTVS